MIGCLSIVDIIFRFVFASVSVFATAINGEFVRHLQAVLDVNSNCPFTGPISKGPPRFQKIRWSQSDARGI